MMINVRQEDLLPPAEAVGEQVPGEVQDAIRTLLRWAGDDPDREGLFDTPERVGRAWRDYCSGYREDPSVHLQAAFGEVGGYNEIVVLRDIPFQSRCEHHLAPIVGTASIAYLPADRIIGISELAQVLHRYARRLQFQERLTAEVAQCLWSSLRPQGIAVVVKASHGCMTSRGVRTLNVNMVTSKLLGCFKDDAISRNTALAILGIGTSK
ncbi:GTP cyclohydrolase I FolE [Novosphingobium sp. PS1R-30]|uniref:GTP cyclohydrolase 1 n=1 Tax=Novosphingobium anseongense TaxID=3133436 RepID=A0ABU8S437_9SPHN